MFNLVCTLDIFSVLFFLGHPVCSSGKPINFLMDSPCRIIWPIKKTLIPCKLDWFCEHVMSIIRHPRDEYL